MRLVFLFLLFSQIAFAQKQQATISGKVTDENDDPVAGVSVIILGKNSGAITSDSGTFTIKVKPETPVGLVFSATGFHEIQKNFFLNSAENEFVIIRLIKSEKILDEVIVTDKKFESPPGAIKINPKSAVAMPSVGGGIEAMVKSFTGSNNELTSQYNVRGGNFDENLIYINGFEIYRPYLVSSGQQEGLSFINPALTKNVSFYTGGFEAKYGDKLSSVLDIEYKSPLAFTGSAYISLLEQGLQFGQTKNRFTYLLGIRNKSNENILKNQPTVGSYLPSASDFQANAAYTFSPKFKVEVLAIHSVSKFNFRPESVKKTSSVFSPIYTSNVGIDIYFEGAEKDSYSTSLLGLTLIHQPNENLKFKWMLSGFKDVEKENYDIGSAYLFGNRDFDNSSSTFGEIINPLGAGYYQDFGRNELNISILKFENKGFLKVKNHNILWGAAIEQNKISDNLRQWQYQDSAGYNIPYNSNELNFKNSVHSKTNISAIKFNAYLQDEFRVFKKNKEYFITGGVRLNFNDLNNEVLVSPRIQAGLINNNITYRIAGGIYQQPPFYRELRDKSGNVDITIKAQKSWQLVAGTDYNFTGLNGRPMKITAEAYFKNMWDVIPYDIDNVKIKYIGGNIAKAYATGIELRIFGELLKDAESWISLGIMETKEDLQNDYYYNYYNRSGELIRSTTTDKVIADSSKVNIGYIRRPSDRRITAGVFIQDYLSTNKNFKVHLNLLYGSNMTFSIPDNPRFRNALIIDPYIRLDAGFSVLLLSEKKIRRSHAPFKAIKTSWLSLEILNIIDRQNTISYQLIKDFSNTTFAMPNRLTPRLVNLKLFASF